MEQENQVAAVETNTESNSTSIESSNENKETPTETAKPNGYEGDNFVEFTPEQQKRLNTLAKKAGKAEREAQELRRIAKEQFDLINELNANQQKVVNHLQETDYAKAETQIRAEKKAAFERGDLDAYEAANDKLLEIKLAKQGQKNQPQVQQPRGFNPSDAVQEAVAKGSLTPSDAEVYRAWATETDEYGNLKRPWIQETDPRFTAAGAEGAAVFKNPSYVNKGFAEKLGEIDRRMGVVNRQTGGAAVLSGGNLQRSTKSGNVTLTPYQEALAVKTNFAGRGKSRQDHIEAYRKQVAEVKGGRK